ncbi:MAG: DUF6178 family protein [Candidatus Binatus sp.]|uniref:DUF6178 family protein n=1 Tax=Candidatus Binatus sp. TaxID=2811406 RepID=UPI0027220768|nr:DUF6178 family protein [Candidatus Binatus sp.]MDO8430807.1 DUF6178 family protein [Candidatus Binatus sp.]
MAVRGESEFLNLPFQEKLEFLYGLPARQKRDLILSAPEAERLVQSFSPETLFYTLKEIGTADAGDLLSLALPEQVMSLFDLDCWNRDRPNVDRMREWIEAMSEGGRRRMADGLMQLDMEMMSLLLRGYIKVHRLDDPASSPDAPSNRFVQFDENYLIEFILHDAISQHISDFLDEAFERDYTYFAALMEEIYWGVEAELEEQAYQFRCTRLSDRGFPDFFEAQNVFAYLNPAQFLKIRAAHEKPSRAELPPDTELIAPEMSPALTGYESSLFNTALTAGFAMQGKRQLKGEMAMVSNEVLVARSIDFGDLEAVHVAVEMTHNYLNLALEHLAGGDLQSAIEHLRDTHLKLLFRLGVSLTIDLRTRAGQALAKLGLTSVKAREISYLDSPYREALAGFLERQPRFYSALDGAGGVDYRDFRIMRDLHLSYAIIDQVESAAELFKHLFAIDIASPNFRAQMAAREIRLSQLLLTALARMALDRRLAIEPIEDVRLTAMRDAIMTNHGRPARLNDDFRRLVDSALTERLDSGARSRTAAFLNSCLNLLEDEFAELGNEREIDARFIASVLVRSANA